VVLDLQSKESGAARETASVAGRCVLLIDLDDDTRQLLTATLRSYGAEVVAVESMQQANAALERLRPDVVVSNCLVDARDAAVLMQQVRALEAQRQRRIPTIAVTPSDGRPITLDQAAVSSQIRVPKKLVLARLASIMGIVVPKTLSA